jgi:hypothetical protein
LFEGFFIFLRNTEFKFYRSIHIHILLLIHYIVNGGVKAGVRIPPMTEVTGILLILS